MGSRKAFKSVEKKDFTFVENGQTYRTIGGFDNLKVLIREKGAVRAPEISHTANRIYAVVQKGKLKHLAISAEEQRLADRVKKEFNLQ